MSFEIINPTMPIEGFKAVRITCNVLKPMPEDFREMANMCAKELIKAIQAGKYEADLMRLVEPSVD